MNLPESFLAVPIAHRGYHDRAAGRVENSRAAFEAAIAAGYGIELDLQPSKDGVPMVFHDYDLRRLTGETGPVAQRTAEELGQITLTGGGEAVPTLAEVLRLVAGRVPLLIEIKDQDGILGPNVGALERASAEALAGYRGDVALMSFNPHSMAAMAELLPEVPRGLVTDDYRPEDWETIPEARRAELREIPDYDRVGACFISHRHGALGDARVAELKAQGAEILCWTIRSAAEEAKAREIAANVTFEGYAAA
ncbi:glycerophosphodiester phosphodiesterase family protein [Vannielia litorea]|uniref:Glycerophosphoryl diester phosphodiesterase n=1 Tax=Vannielia litorea TaxID=1217970 RepID=A0A1N6H2L0_9RHOB|nr:glycerophosphodiester phosphodiesterase family protein [Vannielia litorea]SIO13932.1 Glycerophosphoryl diester phosphodiesterase [Vannielia litorea]